MIFLAGPHGAGKTKSAEILADLGFVTIDLGPTLRRLYAEQTHPRSFEEWVQEGEQTRGLAFTDELLVQEILLLKAGLERNAPQADIVVTGNRSWQGIEYIVNRVPAVNGRGWNVIFVDAPFETMRERYNSRERKCLAPPEFQAFLDRDVELGLESIRRLTHFVVWNAGQLDDFRGVFRKL